MLTLTALGALDLRDEDGRPLEPVLAQSKRAALLAYLALARPGGLQRRDSLLATFWPELDKLRGRNALNQALSFLRRELGEGILVTRGPEEVGVELSRIQCDVVAFRAGLEAGDWAKALDLYRGDLLDGLHVAGAGPFADWVDRERTRLREAAAKAAWALARERIGTGALVEAERAAQRALELVPTEESPVREFVEALTRAGDRGAALRFSEKFAAVLARELEVEPAPATLAVVEAVRSGEISSADGGTASAGTGGQARSGETQVGTVSALSDDRGGAAETAPVLSSARGRGWGRISLYAASLAITLAAVGLVGVWDRGFGGPGTLLGEGTLEPYARAVVADFEFSEDPGLGRTVAHCLMVALDQSDLVRPLTPVEIGSALQRMTRDPAAPVDEETAHEIAVRDGYPLVVVGEMEDAGRGYLLAVRLEAAETRAVLGRFSEIATGGPEDLLPALDRLAADIRRVIGDSRRAIRQSPPLAQVTTPSLEALRLYTDAERLRTMVGNPLDAIPLLERAIALDSGFAMAYRAWGKVLNSYLTQWEKQEELGQLAFQHRDRLVEYERLLVEAGHTFGQTRRGPDSPPVDECGLWGPVLKVYEDYVHRHPSDPRPLQNLGYNLDRMGRFQEAEAAYRRGVELAPTPGLYNNLIRSLLRQRRWEEARSAHTEWGERLGKEDGRWILAGASMAERQRDFPAVDSVYRAYVERGYGAEPLFRLAQGQFDAVRGRLAAAEEHFRQAIQSMEESGDLVAPLAWITTREMIRLIVRGDSAGAVQEVRAAIDGLPPDQEPAGAWINVGLLFALAGDAGGARWAADTLTAIRMGPWSLVRGDLRAAIALAEGRPEESLLLLEESEIPCWGNPGADPRGDPRWRRILAGRAQEARGNPNEAVASYVGYLTDPPLARPTALDAIFLFDTLERLGRLHETLGDRSEAAAYYLRAAELWKDADPELQPRVEELRSEAKRLLEARLSVRIP